MAEVIIQSFLIKFACVYSTLISKQCVHMDPGVCIQSADRQLNWRDSVAPNKCFDSSTDDQIDVFGNVFFNYRTIGSRTCNKTAKHIVVSILKTRVLITIIWAQIGS